MIGEFVLSLHNLDCLEIAPNTCILQSVQSLTLLLPFNQSLTDFLHTGTGPQRTFIETAFGSAQILANLADGYTSPYVNAKGVQVFEWLFGTSGLDNMRISVSRSFLAYVAPSQWKRVLT